MPCYRPLQGFFDPRVFAETGKRNLKVVQGHRKDRPLVKNQFMEELLVPCGSCVGCRLERSRQWAIRCMHEASLYENNCFITLTFAPEHLPEDGSLDVKVFQDFMKRLRERFVPTAPKGLSKEEKDAFFAKHGIRFYHCGEYGGKNGRPHYHACLFNFDFLDKYEWRKSESGFPLFRSPALEELWPFGHSEIGTVTFESAAYCARYIVDKVNGAYADLHYDGRKPEYTTMSRRPGIGRNWYVKHKNDVYPSDEIIVNGMSVLPPRYYDSLYEIDNPEGLIHIKEKRVERASNHASDNTPKRLAVKEKVKKSKLANSLHKNKHKDPGLC